jgi:hypothetical protein
MFLVNQGSQIKAFVDSVLDGVEQIAAGAGGAVSGLIEKALAQSLPMVIGFLASLLGLGGISEKIKEILQKVQEPVGKVIDSIIGTVVRIGKGLWNKFKSKMQGGDDSPEGKQKRLDEGVDAGVSAVNRFAGRPVAGKILRPLLGAIRLRYGLVRLEPVLEGGTWSVEGEINPRKKKQTSAKEEVDYSRPSGFRNGVRDTVWDLAKAANGSVYDPLTRKRMLKGEPWDMGHKPGYEFRKHQAYAIERGISREEFIVEHNNPRHYRPELPSSNRSHADEDMTGRYKGRKRKK